MAVETAGHDDHVRSKSDRGGYDEPLDDPNIFHISAARGHWDIQRRPEAAAFTFFVEIAGSGIERELMGRDVEHVRIVFEDVLGSVAMMNVPVEDEDTRRGAVGLQCTHSDCHVIEEAETHGARSFRVMSRRPHCGEAAVDLSCENPSC